MVTEIREYFQKVSIAIADCELCCNTYEDAEHYNGSDLLHVATIEKYIAMIEDSIIQNEKHTGIALSGLLPEISVLLEEFKPLSAQIDFAGIMGDRDAFTYLAQVNRNFETFIALLKERCTAHGIQLPELQRELEYDSEPQQIILPKELNTDEARRILEKAAGVGVMSIDTSGYHWNGTAPQLALFAEMVSEKLELANKWKPFEMLFNKKNLAQTRYGSTEKIGKVKDGDIIESIFK